MLYSIYSILQYFVYCDCRHEVVDDVDQNKTHFQSLEVGFTNEAWSVFMLSQLTHFAKNFIACFSVLMKLPVLGINYL